MSYPASNKESLSSFFFVIYKRKFFIFAFFITTYLGIIAGTWLAPQYYKATTKLIIHTNPKQEISLFADLEVFGERSQRVNIAQDMVHVLSSEDLVREIVSSFGLDKMYYKRIYEPESLRDVVWYYIHQAIDVIKSPYTYTKRLLVHLGLLDPETGEEDYIFLATQEFLDDWLDVKAERESRVINISVWGSEPRLAAAIANRMGELLIERTLMITRNKALEGYNFTASQIQNVEDRYLKSHDELGKFRKDNNIVAMKEQKENLISQFKRFETDVAEIKADLQGIKEKAEDTRARLDIEEEKIITSTVTGNNPIMMGLKSQINEAEIKLSSMIVGMTDKNPRVLELKARINDIRNKLNKELEEITLNRTEDINPTHQKLSQMLLELETKEVYLIGKMSVLNTTIAKIKKELSLIPQKEVEYNKLETIAGVYKDIYRVVKDKFEKLLILKASGVNEYGLSFISKAELPEIMSQTWPMWDINTVYVGLPLSFFMAFFVGFFVDFWFDSFSTKKEVEFNLELPVIGMIPDLKKKKARRAEYYIMPDRNIVSWVDAKLISDGTEKKGNDLF